MFVAKSNIAGLGLFARVDISKDSTVCLHTGRCLSSVHGNFSLYLLETKWENPVTRKVEKWYLDSRDKRNASGRYINDACDYEGVPEDFCTEFSNNVTIGHKQSSEVHPIIGLHYVKVRARDDIKAGEEILGAYGVKYWEFWQHYSTQDPNMYTGGKYEKVIESST